MLRWTANKPCLGSGERMSPVSRAVCYTDIVKGLSQRQLLYWLAECAEMQETHGELFPQSKI